MNEIKLKLSDEENEMCSKTLIIGGFGTGTYTCFRYMVLKEKTKSILIDDYSNKDLIKILEKDNLDTFFYKDTFDENKIINFNKLDKIFINLLEANLYNTNIFHLKNLVLRVGYNFNQISIFKKFGVDSILKKFDKILVFSPKSFNNDDDDIKNLLKFSLPREIYPYIDMFNGKVEEFIEIKKNSIKYKVLNIPYEDFEKMHNRLIYNY